MQHAKQTAIINYIPWTVNISDQRVHASKYMHMYGHGFFQFTTKNENNKNNQAN